MFLSFDQFCSLFLTYHLLKSIYWWFKQPPSYPLWLNQEGEYPLCLKVSGFHFLFLGFNNLYYRSSENRNGAPVYHMPSYLLYYLILIRSVNLYKDETGNWRFEFGDCQQNISFLNGQEGHTPIGTFQYKHGSGKITVERAKINFEY